MDEHLYTIRVTIVAGRLQTNVYAYLEDPEGLPLDARRTETAPRAGCAYAAALRSLHELAGVAGLLLPM